MAHTEYEVGLNLSEKCFHISVVSAEAEEHFLYPMRSAIATCAPDYCFSRNTYHCPFLLMEIISGALALTSPVSTDIAVSGQAVLLETRRPHIYGVIGNEPIEMYWLHFGGVDAQKNYDYLIKKNKSHVFPVSGDFTIKFQNLIANIASGHRESEMLISARIYELLALLMNEKIERNPIENVLFYIQKHYGEKLNMEELSGLAYMSEPYFYSCFKQYTGISPYQYIIQMRLTISKHILLHSNKSIDQIAYDVGFSSPSAFIAAFEKKYSITPGKMRSQMATKSIKE